MDRTEIDRQVAAVFAGRPTRSTRVAVEQEQFAVDLVCGGHVAPMRVRAAVTALHGAEALTFEPGGQVEQQGRDTGVGEVSGDLRTHSAGAEYGGSAR